MSYLLDADSLTDAELTAYFEGADSNRALVVERCCPWAASYRPLTNEQYAHAWLLADGFGRCTPAYARDLEIYGDWSHFRDSTDICLFAVAHYLRYLDRQEG